MCKVAALIGFVFIVFIIWIIYLANTGGHSVFFEWVHVIPYGDKVGHVGIFGFLTFIAIIASRFKRFSVKCVTLYYGAICVGLFVIAEECSQAFVATRTFDLYDLAADFIGITGASVIAFFIHQKIKMSRNSA